MAATIYLELQFLGQEFGGRPASIPGTQYIGLLVAPSWTASTAVAVGAVVIGSAFATASMPTPNNHVYICTTAGTTGASEPAWDQTGGATTTDGTAVWTEMTPTLRAGTLTGIECAAAGYARTGVTNNTTNFAAGAAGSGVAPCTKPTAQPVTIAATGTIGQVVGIITADAASGGNLRTFGLLASAVTIPTGANVVCIAGGLIWTF